MTHLTTKPPLVTLVGASPLYVALVRATDLHRRQKLYLAKTPGFYFICSFAPWREAFILIVA
jgi:hypothetical protein